jgi:hypothetical protein
MLDDVIRLSVKLRAQTPVEVAHHMSEAVKTSKAMRLSASEAENVVRPVLAASVEGRPNRWAVQCDYRHGPEALCDVLVNEAESTFGESALTTDSVVMWVPEHQDASVDPLFASMNMVRPVKMQHPPFRQHAVYSHQVRQPGVNEYQNGGWAVVLQELQDV